jgi:hypothetical protein
MLEHIVPDRSGESVGEDDYLDYYNQSTAEERVAFADSIRDKIARNQDLTPFEKLFLEKNTAFFHAEDQPPYGRRPN